MSKLYKDIPLRGAYHGEFVMFLPQYVVPMHYSHKEEVEGRSYLQKDSLINTYSEMILF